MIITISGAQGQGKSTVLNDLAARGYNVIANKTSRGILNEWGLTLNEVNKYPPLTKKFQERIIKDHLMHQEEAYNSSELYFSERSFADIFTYATFALGSYNEYSEWLNEYFTICATHQKRYRKIIYLSGRTYTPEEDGVRSINIHFSTAVDLLIKHNLYAFDYPRGNIVEVSSPNHYERINQILELIKEL